MSMADVLQAVRHQHDAELEDLDRYVLRSVMTL